MPQTICKSCQKQLKAATAFRKRCISAQNQLVKLTAEVTTHSTEEETTQILKDVELNKEIDEIPLSEVQLLWKTEKDTQVTEINVQKAVNDATLNRADYDKDTASGSDYESENESAASKDTTKRIKLKSKLEPDILLPKERNFICDQCGNHITGRFAFEIHLRRHFGVKQYQCELCSDCFCTHSELKRHMRRHTGERPFACRHCERRFTDYSSRTKHERTHTNERPFSCVHCGKAFTNSYVLKNHMLTHTGERLFNCEICVKSFQRQTHLTTHYRSSMHKQNEEKHKILNQLQQKQNQQQQQQQSIKLENLIINLS